MNEDLSKLDLLELLSRLTPVAEPPPVSLWPETQAWLWIGVAFAVFTAWLLRLWFVHRRANAYRRAALREIAAAENSPAVIAEILRRTALVAFRRHDVASLYGDAWLAFLDRTSPGDHFSKGQGRAFASAPYVREVEDATQFGALASRWVRQHRRDSKEGS